MQLQAVISCLSDHKAREAIAKIEEGQLANYSPSSGVLQSS